MPSDLNEPSSYTIDMEPVGRRAQVKRGGTILDAARESGVGIVSLCGGEGWCEGCVIRVENGECQIPTETERSILSEQMLQAGYRLACQAIPENNIKIYIPPESLSAPQRLQIEGRDLGIELDPLVRAAEITLTPPSIKDLHSDTERLRGTLAELGYRNVRIEFPVLDTLSDKLRVQNWKLRLALRENEIVAVLPIGTTLLGFAVDIGTTKLAGYLVDLSTGETIAKTGVMNPQIAYGEDVISRIAYSQDEEGGGRLLQSCLVDALNQMLAELHKTADTQKEQVVQAVIVGNTAMHHIFAGLPVTQLAMAPYVPSVSEALAFQASRIGLQIAPGAYIQLLPNIAGYVGADHVAVILATEVWRAKRPTMVIDIGTNTEISLAVHGHLFSCSCASGPAFEGAHIRDGMRAAEGAIESFQILDGQKYSYTIGDQPPVGICGSGILDVVAELRKAGILDVKGAFQPVHPDVRLTDSGSKFVLVDAERTGHGREISISRRDVNEIQLAKAAVRSGIDVILEAAEIRPEELSKIVIAGAFGTYIRLESVIRIGMLPNLPLDRFMQVGNAAGMGAKQALVSAKHLRLAKEIARKVIYIELTTHPDFQKRFLNSMFL